MVEGLRPVVGTALAERQAAAKSRESGKTPGSRNPTEVTDGQKLLNRLVAERQMISAEPDPGLTASIAEVIEDFSRRQRFDPTAPAPPLHLTNGSPREAADARIYQGFLTDLLTVVMDGEHGPDLTHAYRHDRLDAVELYDSLAVHLPGGTANDALRIALYRELARIDPARAATLLQPMTEDVAGAVKFQTLGVYSFFFTPDTTYELLASISASDDDSGLPRRQSAWINSSRDFVATYGSDYLHWVEKLPTGINRDCAAVALLSLLQENDLPSYRRMRALVTDPRMLEDLPPR
jgi:hypothetical protein